VSIPDFVQLIPPPGIVNQADFLYFVTYHLITLMIIAYTFMALLKNSNRIARSLSASGHTPILSPGWGNTSIGRAIGHRTPEMLRGGGASGDFVQNWLQGLGSRS